MTAGEGFIALAALIVAKWKPVPAMFACLAKIGGESRRGAGAGPREANTDQAAAAIQSAYALGGTKPATAKVIVRRIAPRGACDCISRPAALLRPLLSGGLGFALRAEQEHCQGGEERGNSTVGNGTGNPGIVHQ